MRGLTSILAGALLLLPAAPAQAHHSDSMFDHQHPVTATGTVKQFLWAQPHVWIYLMVPNGKPNGLDEWRIEGPSISTIARWGWTQYSLKSGDKIQVVLFPDITGAHHGRFSSVYGPDGTVIGSGGR